MVQLEINMEKKKQIEKLILQDGRSCSNFRDNRYRWGEIVQILKDEHITLQDTDILEVGYTEGYDDGDSSRDPYYDFRIIRVRDETEKEIERRVQAKIDAHVFSTKRRYEQYLKLKKEFGDELT